ncbi:LEAF RUST 10 DISEASE-RESISTANCE LOCUS RECEPTOR-LIKE PROTEIN KINASE-like 1.1 [Glycine soja]|uniref:LEAF RUST 10 DISEASE-RESISTANCE LOCUS RECEPTOR-LIKE PROTEIN KINASE-like 1.1 n=1 Tax=Glycine soja TaxID=3848 RepID=A0A445F3Z5_GLYSO|nr:LEAF RUST 10 DISEASE-RESISTANCE LOCUS RECEPTOR-LIKE PROTEIN KINASE-like 1.1 [Glycine soja]
MMLLILFIGNGNGHKEECPLWFDCGNHGRFEWPFTKVEHQDCGIWPIHGCDDDLINPNYVLLKIGPSSIKVQKFEMQRFATIVYFTDHHLRNLLQSDSCEIFSYNITLPPSSPLGYFTINNNITLFKCNRTLQGSLAACSMVQLPMNGFAVSANPFAFLTAEISVQFLPSDECMQCHHYRGHCHLDSQRKVNCAQRKGKSSAWKLGLTLGLGVAPAWMIIIFGLILTLRRCKRQYGLAQTQLQSRNTRIDPYEKSDSMTDRIFFGVPVFSYKELQEATNNFDHKTKLGEGGFGSVYYGKLQDGREVAVKHLFEHNYKRVQQFMNEIEILTHLRHRNLVSLYGCTSRHSRELLLVYEYVPNGTLAYHLHERDDSLTWPIRMQIAIETATALAYLHASDIIHRDVKTSNILLDNNFWVKVADFGLSRLLPNDVSHVSTAPQGTPGYLDPEYFQHYQLTDKSDVYSFGVVLVELISSMPALDAAREIDEINLANLAIKRIQNGKLGELVAKSLGFDSDQEVTRTLASVAELAFSVCAGGPAIKTLHG